MKIAELEKTGQSLSVHRLNAPYAADIKSGLGLWLVPQVMFSVLHLSSVALNDWIRSTGGTPPSPFFSAHDLLAFAALQGFLFAAYLVPDFIALFPPRAFRFDRAKNVFIVDGKDVSRLDALSLRLQDGWGPSRRAFRILASAGDKTYVIAQTRRVTTATYAGREYASVVVRESLQSKYWFHRWAQYSLRDCIERSVWCQSPEHQRGQGNLNEGHA